MDAHYHGSNICIAEEWLDFMDVFFIVLLPCSVKIGIIFLKKVYF